MYTSCPVCKTNFNVTQAQLQVAQGKVRCGSCKNVFNARQYIQYQTIPTKTPSTPKPEEPRSAVSRSAASKSRAPITTKPATQTQTASNRKNIEQSRKDIRNKTSDTFSATSHQSTQQETPLDPPLNTPINTQSNKETSSKKTTTDNLNIDDIFNALDTQLSQGTYIDIAKPLDVDIREAAFDDIFDKDAVLDEDAEDELPEDVITKTPNTTQNHVDAIPAIKTATNNINTDKVEIEKIIPEKFESVETTEEFQTDKKSQIDTEPQTDKEAQTYEELGSEPIHQSTFDFVSLPDEQVISTEDKKELRAVNAPLNEVKDNLAASSTDHKALHQAIDNIIKIENNIPTPYEENDADHFVIDVETHPEVELVDEEDIDKLFASTDSLNITDLKYDNYKDKQSFDSSVTKTNVVNSLSVEIPIDPEFKIETTPEDNFNNQAEDNVNPSNFSSDSLNIEDLNLDGLDLDQNLEQDLDQDLDVTEEESVDEFDPDKILIDAGVEPLDDNIEFEEEIILNDIPSIENFDDSVPASLRDAVTSLEQQPVSLQKRFLYSAGMLALILLLGFQLVLFKSTAIANQIPALQPTLTSICDKLPCRYTGSHNSKQIKILNRDVRLHPKIKGALLITATIINQARYAQPYPTILLKFTDLSGGTVAQRYFQPKEYLGLLNKPFALIPSKKPVQLNIELLDPGSDAINFQFFFL